MVWSVRGQNRILPVTGQTRCFNEAGQERECPDSGQDGDENGTSSARTALRAPGRRWLDRRTVLRRERVSRSQAGIGNMMMEQRMTVNPPHSAPR